MYDKNLILVRGVSGAGKSTVGELFDDEDTTVVLSTDDLFMVDGEYVFDPSKLPEYHAITVNKVKELMIEYDWKSKDRDFSWFEVNKIIVCNTFTQEWEMEPYIDLAQGHDWRVHTIVVENRHGSESTHGVPAHSINAQKDRFEVVL